MHPRCGWQLNLRLRSQKGNSHWNHKTAYQVAESQNELLRENIFESDEDFERVCRYCPRIAELLAKVVHCASRCHEVPTEDPCQPGLRDRFIGELFALVVLLSDAFVAMKTMHVRSQRCGFFQDRLQAADGVADDSVQSGV